MSTTKQQTYSFDVVGEAPAEPRVRQEPRPASPQQGQGGTVGDVEAPSSRVPEEITRD